MAEQADGAGPAVSSREQRDYPADVSSVAATKNTFAIPRLPHRNVPLIVVGAGASASASATCEQKCAAASCCTDTAQCDQNPFAGVSLVVREAVGEGEGAETPNPFAALAQRAPEQWKVNELPENKRDEEEPIAVSTEVLCGEEEEEVLFKGDCKLYQLVRSTDVAEESDNVGELKWKERTDAGVVHLNRHRETETIRAIVRLRGVLSILLNTVISVESVEPIGQKSVKFVGAEQSGDEMSSFRLNLLHSDKRQQMLHVVDGLRKCA